VLSVRFEVLLTVNMKVTVLLDVIMSSLIYMVPMFWLNLLPPSSEKMEATGSSEILVPNLLNYPSHSRRQLSLMFSADQIPNLI
jgi:hypothetical protein